MNELEQRTKDLIRAHPTWTDRDIEIEIRGITGRRPLMPVIRQWMQEVREDKKA